MLIIQDKLVSEDIIKEHFICNLDACKGACCWEGDSGAPLEKEEFDILEQIYPTVKPLLSEEGKQAIQEKGLYVYYKEGKEYGTPLIDNGACAFLLFEENGMAKCAIEKANDQGLIDYKKPLSCHLYPIRITEDHQTGFVGLNYDRWDICSAACKLGKKEQLPIYKFVKEAIIRKYGDDFYNELDAAAQYLEE